MRKSREAEKGNVDADKIREMHHSSFAKEFFPSEKLRHLLTRNLKQPFKNLKKKGKLIVKGI